MQIKQLIGIMNRPWAMEPQAAHQWSKFAQQLFDTGVMPQSGLPNQDKRKQYNGWGADGENDSLIFRVDEKANISTNGRIQVVRMDSPILKYDFCGSPGSQTFQQLIRSADGDDKIDAIILWIDSPGGMVDGTESLGKTIKACTKPVIAFADGLMASAAYWIGSSATEIVADDSNNAHNTEIGSIGTMCHWYNDAKALKAAGIDHHIVFADDSADKWGDFFKMNEGDYTDLKKSLNALNDTFLSAVKNNRVGKLKLDKENTLTGKVYNAKDALKYGLIDSLGSFETAVKRASSLATTQKKQLKKQKNMKTAFQLALISASATEFAVTDNGFVLQEESLNNIESTLAENATEIASLKAALKTSDAGAIAKLTADLATATGATDVAQASIAKLTTQLAEAQAAQAASETALEAEKKKPGADFGNTNADADVSESQKEANAINDKFLAAIEGRI